MRTDFDGRGHDMKTDMHQKSKVHLLVDPKQIDVRPDTAADVFAC
jgi:hypothetical protein